MWKSRSKMLRLLAGLLAVTMVTVTVLMDWYSFAEPQQPRLPPRSFASEPAPGAKANNLFWMIQASDGVEACRAFRLQRVSDLHISRFVSPSRTSDFEKFCKETIPIIQPAVTLVTAGDLTDGKTKDGFGSGQSEVEWQTYQTILKRTKVMEKTKWIDIKGNHDTFNVPSLESVHNYYRKYSAWQKDGSFHYVHKTPFGKYSFICVDASLTSGPKKPYNFYGILNANKMKELSALMSESHESNHTIVFGHYPTSSIISVSPGIRTAMRYRILAFDHDLFSFADLKFEEWPVILITNPKSYLYSSYAHEPLRRILHSTHISMVFVKIMIDDIYLGDAIQVSGPLYVLKWSPKNYSQGFHQIAVTVKDISGRNATHLHTFAMQESLSLKFDFLASWLLLTDHYIWVKPPGVVVRTSFSLHVLSKIDLFFYSFLVLNLYTVLGPWFIGELIDDHVGACFSFGLIVNGQFFEGSSTFVFGILQNLGNGIYFAENLYDRYEERPNFLMFPFFRSLKFTFTSTINFQDSQFMIRMGMADGSSHSMFVCLLKIIEEM
ncbi:hypothetical protein E2320_021319 [Naja naja]|nr:hypothetical protein E2320_021319 [Naja naja]